MSCIRLYYGFYNPPAGTPTSWSTGSYKIIYRRFLFSLMYAADEYAFSVHHDLCAMPPSALNPTSSPSVPTPDDQNLCCSNAGRGFRPSDGPSCTTYKKWSVALFRCPSCQHRNCGLQAICGNVLHLLPLGIQKKGLEAFPGCLSQCFGPSCCSVFFI